MDTYRELTRSGVTTRAAAGLTGVPRATATRKMPHLDVPRVPVAPANKLTDAERALVLATLDSDEFIDQAPLQAYATLLARGQYLCSVSTMYRVLAEHGQVRNGAGSRSTRRGRCRSWSRAVPARCTRGTSPSSPGRSRAATTKHT
jgi:hypothetical protein